jgi:ATP diphosphatase
MKPSRDISRLIEIMAALRAPKDGCPWDLQQTFASVAPYTIEEAYEVVDAIDNGDLHDLREELGDLLFQVVFHSRMAEEQGVFDFGGVVEAITAKMIRRHPHVFGDSPDRSPEQIKAAWAEVKAQEKAERVAAREAAGKKASPRKGLLSDIPVALPGLSRAVKLQSKASTVGFDWNDAQLVIGKIREELDEVTVAIDSGDVQAIADEIGDLLFAVANLARHTQSDPEAAVRSTNAKFERRFRFIEEGLIGLGKTLESASLEEMDALWDEAKRKGL